MATRPLRNRVDPFGALHAVAARGTLMGNRGGRFHTATQTLTARRFVSRRWIACLCDFKSRHRDVWGASYTELFFLDEVTALAAGHRPCFECRRVEAQAFAQAFGGGVAMTADAMDRILDAERREGRGKRLSRSPIDALPNGAMIESGGAAFAVYGEALLPWRFEGYDAAASRSRAGGVNVLTPPSILRALLRGYKPRWHAATGAGGPSP